MLLRSILAVFVLSLVSALCAAELVLKSGDRINLAIGGVAEADIAQINRVYTINDQGSINLLYLKQVKASGLKPSELQTKIEKAYVDEGYFLRPSVTVTLDDKTTERFVYVVSGCQQNGPVTYTPDMKIMMAISAARGFSPFARRSKVGILRAGKMISLDLTKPGPAMETTLEPGDQIIVRE